MFIKKEGIVRKTAARFESSKKKISWKSRKEKADMKGRYDDKKESGKQHIKEKDVENRTSNIAHKKASRKS